MLIPKLITPRSAPRCETNEGAKFRMQVLTDR
jgi:hypothetical protein